MKGHPKAIEKRERKVAETTQKRADEAARKEAEKWRDDDKQVAAKAARKADAESKAEEKLRRKQELKGLEEEENRQLQSTNKGKKAAPKKMTRAEIAMRQLQLLKEASKSAPSASASNIVSSKEVDHDLMQPNINHILREQQFDAMLKGQSADVEATNIDDALLQLESSNSPQADRHPERRAKAAFKAYEEEWTERIRTENPGLKRSQIKERIWKQWQKAPENPMNERD